ncbi:helix-turn-helix domain-containing protein [Candidatus Gottesmanbacteria bacterium]|nr:helix-turn-helix domain-containing protein [Candidatus Gottesmanbacteria bacterium]
MKREDAANVKIDFAALKEKLRKAYSKLDQMEEYIHHYGCRQTYITEYFGERNSSFCKKCDNCLTGFKRRERAAGEDKKEKSYHHKKEFVSRSDAKYLTMETEEDLSQKAKLPTKLTQLETFDLYNKGFTIEQMAVARELKAATIVEHLCFLMKTGLPVHLDKLVNKDKQKKIREAAKKIGFNKLTPLKESLDEEISWEEIKLVLAAEKK